MPEQNPDQVGQFTRISYLIRKPELTADEANELTELIMKMASANVLDRIDTIRTRLESKFDSQNAKFDSQNAKFDGNIVRLESKFDGNIVRLESKIDSQNAKYNTMIVILSILAATGVLGFLANIFNWGG